MLKVLFRFLFPERCVLCKRIGVCICETCRDDLGFQARITDCPGLGGIIYCFDYHNPIVRKSIAAYKFKYVESLGEIFGEYMVNAWRKFELTVSPAVCMVPLHKDRLNQRGFNQSEILAKVFCVKTGMEFVDLLERKIYDRPQSKLNRQERLRHLVGHFEIKERRLVPKEVLLVDDVVTTGSSLKECAKVLNDAGVEQVYGLVLARSEISIASDWRFC